MSKSRYQWIEVEHGAPTQSWPPVHVSVHPGYAEIATPLRIIAQPLSFTIFRLESVPLSAWSGHFPVGSDVRPSVQALALGLPRDFAWGYHGLALRYADPEGLLHTRYLNTSQTARPRETGHAIQVWDGDAVFYTLATIGEPPPKRWPPAIASALADGCRWLQAYYPHLSALSVTRAWWWQTPGLLLRPLGAAPGHAPARGLRLLPDHYNSNAFILKQTLDRRGGI